MTFPQRIEIAGLDDRVTVFRVQDEVDAFVIRTERFVALVDTLSTPDLCRAVLRQLETELSDRPLVVINTHADWDHVWGNAAVAGLAPIIAHSSVLGRLRSTAARATLRTKAGQDDRFAAVTLIEPTIVLDDSLTLVGGDLTLELLHTPGHTDDHVAVWIPELRLCLAGDAAEDPLPEVTDPETPGDLGRLRSSLRRLRDLRPLIVLPSHGETTGPELLDRNLAYFEALTARVRALPTAALTLAEPPGLEYATFLSTTRELPDAAALFYQACHRKAVRATILERLSDTSPVAAGCAQPIDFASEAPEPRTLKVKWIHGSPSAKNNTDPAVQVHSQDEHTFILRQNKAIHYEAPFLYLLFGNTHAVLIDTGATESAEYFPLRRVVDSLVEDWLSAHPRDNYTLLVLHSHAHGDHIAGDAQFADRTDTVLVGADLRTVQEFFGFGNDPDQMARVDLGGRVLECLASPGHHEAAVTFYDPYTGFLLTGDTVYPGRLYVEDLPAFRRTIDRLIAFTETRPVTQVLGCHIEMTAEPGVDYPVRTTYQPDEKPLQMTVGHLHDIREALDEIGYRPGRHAFPDFVICYED